MGQFEIIKDVGSSIQQLLQDKLKAAGYKDVEIYTCIPTEENVKKLPALCLFLGSVTVDGLIRERPEILVSTMSEEGQIDEYFTDSPMRLRLYYFLSAWGKTPEEEHVLLALAMKVLFECPVLESDMLKGNSFILDEGVPIRPVEEPKFGYEETMAFWRSLGEKVRPIVQYCAYAHIHSERRIREVPRVLEVGLDISGSKGMYPP
jgi:hypothetical protein